MGQVGRSMSLKMTLPLTIMAGLATKASIDFESAFTGVRKTVNATEEQFAVLKKSLMGLAREIPLSTQEIFGIAEAAGQLGIKTENIQAFTKVMADLGATTNLSADEAATQLARFANITGMSQDQFDKLGSTIVHLGNNMATTEAEIVEMGMRLAGAGKLVGISEAKIMGLSAALTSVGINAEAGGTAFSQVMRKIDKDIGSGSEKMQGFAYVSNMTVKDFETLWKKDAAEAVLKFTEGLGRMSKEGVNINQVLDALGMEGIRISDALLRASGSGKLFRDAMVMGGEAWKENIALTKEANLRYGTTASRLTIAKNKVMQMAASFGDILAKALLTVVQFLEPVIDWLTKMGPVGKTIIIVIGALAAAIGPLLIGLGLMATMFGAIVAVATPALIALIAPIAAVTAAIAAIGFAIIQVIRHWDDLKAAFSAIKIAIFDKISSLLNMLPDWIKKKVGIGIETKPLASAGIAAPAGAVGATAGSQRSETDININVSSDAGSTATIEKVKKKKGDANVSTDLLGYVGAYY
ncbi:MAG: phage tail tape measure protein [Candidatus Woesearchaeota archaeon]